MLGLTSYSWGLIISEGRLHHGGGYKDYTKSLKRESVTNVYGVYYDGFCGTVNFYINGVDQGIAFYDLHLINDPLRPMLSCSGQNIKLSMLTQRKSIISLQEKCRLSIIYCYETLHA